MVRPRHVVEGRHGCRAAQGVREGRLSVGEGWPRATRRGLMMKTVVGIFTTSAAAERAADQLVARGLARECLNYLIPGASPTPLEAVPTTETEQPGMGKVLGGVVGGVAGASGGLLGAAVASAIVPGIGPITAIGLAAGAAAGGALENTLSTGLPKDELFVYEDALRQGRTVLIVLAADDGQAGLAREVLAGQGAESLDAARQRWWLGLRDAEAETYTAAGGDFRRDEAVYRRGFEAALHAAIVGQPYREALDYLRTHYPDVYQAAFRHGYERGRAYSEQLRKP
jgi:hypothetical protein